MLGYIGVSAVDAVRVYIRVMREGRGLTQEDLGDAIGLSRRAIVEFESGRTDEMKTGPLFRALRVLGASTQHIARLIFEPDLSEEDARHFAQQALGHETVDEIESIAYSIPDDRVAEALRLAEDLRQDPDHILEFIRFGRFLREKSVPYGSGPQDETKKEPPQH